jgi:hypothetical protein
MPEPKLASRSPRRRSREMSRYQAYQAQLACRAVGEIFARAAAFPELAAADAPSLTDPSAHHRLKEASWACHALARQLRTRSRRCSTMR